MMHDQASSYRPSSRPPLLRKMVARDPAEGFRAATPLELLYDLCFVVAIAQAAGSLHHALAHGHGIYAVISFLLVFFAIYWAWISFTWFASAFDTDDPLYRLKVLVQMVGALVLAAGVPRSFEHQDFSLVTIGYTIMRVALVAQWLRVARNEPAMRGVAMRYVVGIVSCQIGWISLLFVRPELWLWGWGLLMASELLVPLWAARAGSSPWHPHHIAERYGLFTIIVIGESVLATTVAIQDAVDPGSHSPELIQLILSAPIILFALWWLYFCRPAHPLLSSTRATFFWGYTHVLVFSAAAAVGAALAVGADQAIGKAHLSSFTAAQILAIPVATYVLSLWLTQFRWRTFPRFESVSFWVAAGIILAAPWTSFPYVLIATTLAILTAVQVVSERVSDDATEEPIHA